ncbi:MAG: DUF177 domain-containing protein [Prolixibacteraceae bacterium]|nr:DUF177 domain-containing protein [Prolixibacteraceae bacterium]
MQRFFNVERLSIYNIAFKGLKEGNHEFGFNIGKPFFENFGNSLVEDGDVHIRLVLEKRTTFMVLHINVSGEVLLNCDRCLELYGQPIENTAKLYVKFDENQEDSGDDIIWLTPDEYQFNVAQLIYEYVITAVPLRHVHPHGKDGKRTCDPLMVEKLKEYRRKDIQENDERWDELKRLMNNN